MEAARSAEQLWQQCISVYFSAIPVGHELETFLRNAVDAECSVNDWYMYEGSRGLKPVEILATTVSTVGSNGLNKRKRVVIGGLDGVVSLLNCHNISDDLADELSKKFILPADTEMSVTPITPIDNVMKIDISDTHVHSPRNSLGVKSDTSPQLMDSVSYSEVTEKSEREFLLEELARIRALKAQLAAPVLAAVIDDQVNRPQRKKFSELEGRLLNLYEKKPPSTAVLSSAAAGAPTASASTMSTLAALGKASLSETDHEDLSCSVCGDGDGFDDNQILICDGCHFAAHQQCYAVKDIPTGEWLCGLCDTKNSKKKKSESSSKEVCCVLCLQTSSFEGGGLMKQLQGKPDQWAHLRCVNWVPEAFMSEDGKYVILKPNKDRDSLRCSICKQKGGAPVQCSFGKCTTAFHVSCAAKSGILDHSELSTSRAVLCQKHSKVHMRVSPAIGKLLSARKQEPYMKFMNDKFVLSLMSPSVTADGSSAGFGGPLVSPSLGTAAIIPADSQSMLMQLIMNVGAMYSAGGFMSSDGQVALLNFAKNHPIVKQYMQSLASMVNLKSKDSKHRSSSSSVFSQSRGVLYPECAIDVSIEDLRGSQQTLPDEAECCECLSNEINIPLWRCGDCGLQIHQKCLNRAGSPFLNYGGGSGVSLDRMSKFPPIGIPPSAASLALAAEKNSIPTFQCPRCVSVANGQCHLKDTFCVLCMQMGGLLLHVDSPDDAAWSPQGFWVHPRCAFWLVPPPNISCLTAPVNLSSVRSVSSSHHFFACVICGSRLGCTVRCQRAYCERRFHVSCGFMNSCSFMVKSSSSGMVLAGAQTTVEGGESALVAALNSEKAGGFKRGVLCWEHSHRKGKNMKAKKPSPRRVEAGRWLPPAVSDDYEESYEDDNKKRRKSESKRDQVKRQRVDSLKPPTAADAIDPSSLATFHFLNGERVAMEEESWEGCCAACRQPWEVDATDVNSIACDDCDQWFHFKCVGITGDKAPEGAFSCPSCIQKKKLTSSPKKFGILKHVEEPVDEQDDEQVDEDDEVDDVTSDDDDGDSVSDSDVPEIEALD